MFEYAIVKATKMKIQDTSIPEVIPEVLKVIKSDGSGIIKTSIWIINELTMHIKKVIVHSFSKHLLLSTYEKKSK